MAPYLMDHQLTELRRGCLVAIRAAFRPSLPLERAAALLGFATADEVNRHC